ncbi:MAG: rRNA maturation RNase YbeY [Lacunisphaera sp.]|nr:rRNA maturation RNase YbeY [Lacunisphaera sp.]
MNRTVAITRRHPRLRLDRRAVGAAIAVLDAHAANFLGGCPPGELSLVFLTDPALAEIHGDFMDDPTATDVITFEGDKSARGSEALAKEAGLVGEICVSADRAARYVGWLEGPRLSSTALAKNDLRGPRLAGTRALHDAFSAELTLYVVHGWLHLAGYDDLQPAKKRRMRAAEKRAMTLLRKAKAMPAFRLV